MAKSFSSVPSPWKFKYKKRAEVKIGSTAPLFSNPGLAESENGIYVYICLIVSSIVSYVVFSDDEGRRPLKHVRNIYASPNIVFC